MKKTKTRAPIDYEVALITATELANTVLKWAPSCPAVIVELAAQFLQIAASSKEAA